MNRIIHNTILTVLDSKGEKSQNLLEPYLVNGRIKIRLFWAVKQPQTFILRLITILSSFNTVKDPLSLTVMHRGQTTESWTTKQPFFKRTLDSRGNPGPSCYLQLVLGHV